MPFDRLPDRIASVSASELMPRYSAPAPPVHDTGATVQKGLQQIEKVIDYMSPFERQKRMIAGVQLKMQRRMMEDYEKNPNKYQVGANGALKPVGTHGSMAAYKSMKETLGILNAKASLDIKRRKLSGGAITPGSPEWYRQQAGISDQMNSAPLLVKEQEYGDAAVDTANPFGAMKHPATGSLTDIDITDEDEESLTGEDE